MCLCLRLWLWLWLLWDSNNLLWSLLLCRLWLTGNNNLSGLRGGDDLRLVWCDSCCNNLLSLRERGNLYGLNLHSLLCLLCYLLCYLLWLLIDSDNLLRLLSCKIWLWLWLLSCCDHLLWFLGEINSLISLSWQLRSAASRCCDNWWLWNALCLLCGCASDLLHWAWSTSCCNNLWLLNYCDDLWLWPCDYLLLWLDDWLVNYCDYLRFWSWNYFWLWLWLDNWSLCGYLWLRSCSWLINNLYNLLRFNWFIIPLYHSRCAGLALDRCYCHYCWGWWWR